MDKIYEQTMLFDFYGELLTEHQRSVYEDAVYRDMSLGEIAQERGISRQGVHDLIKRCDRILQEYESKLHLVERFTKAKKTVAEIVPSVSLPRNCWKSYELRQQILYHTAEFGKFRKYPKQIHKNNRTRSRRWHLRA